MLCLCAACNLTLQLPRLPHCRLAGLSEHTKPSDLLSATSSHGNKSGKKSGLKGGGASKTGARRVLNATHADGAPLKLDMQVVVQIQVFAGVA